MAGGGLAEIDEVGGRWKAGSFVFRRRGRVNLLAELTSGPSTIGERETREPPSMDMGVVWFCMGMHTFMNCPFGEGAG